MPRGLLCTLLVAVAATTSAKSPGGGQAADEIAIRQVFADLTDAWQSADGQAWAEAFLADADFTVWFGLQLQGREPIARGHQFIFDRFYADTVYHLSVRRIRFPAPSVAVVHLEGSVVAAGEELPAEPDSVPLAVLQKVAGQWKIAAFQNTPFAVDRYGRNGDLRRFKGREIPAGQGERQAPTRAGPGGPVDRQRAAGDDARVARRACRAAVNRRRGTGAWASGAFICR